MAIHMPGWLADSVVEGVGDGVSMILFYKYFFSLGEDIGERYWVVPCCIVFSFIEICNISTDCS